MAQTISQLAGIIAGAISDLTTVCHENKLELPDLYNPSFTPESEAFRANASASESAKLAAAACLQLAATLMRPTDIVYQLATGGHHSAAFRVCLEGNVTEILREAGTKGMHVNDIASKCGLEAAKLARIMRYLAVHHCYREVEPDVFANNRVSGAFDTGKDIEKLIADPKIKYEGSGFPALCSHIVDVDLKCSAASGDVLIDPKTAHASDLTTTAFTRAMNTDLTYWDFHSLPEQEDRARKFGFAMQGIAAMQPAGMIFKALDWASVPSTAKIVDVGGGIGTATTPLVQKYPNFTVIVQDLPHVAEEGKKFYTTKMPEAVASGQLQFQGHSFLNKQPIKDADVFVVKQVLHNWPDVYNSTILKNLREVAKPDTKLIIIDNVIPYACRLPSDAVNNLEGDGDVDVAPEPVLPNYGPLSDHGYTLDVTMMFYFNAQEHTILQFQQLLANTGWRLTKCQAIDGKRNLLRSLIAVPA
ncbi:S-adenosyl-L-methionine-dependent methyltransferase [Dendrothele bispora CBS 962.96]|uniref:S-adenosyl-L-methionine-dependent methyltransferase n=1 Tax=Dendrothele bispora (strain CBS 962.96) TaxID=1314807 RepID=A0A4S8KRW4_DENBC|nr:S-adenosyl-L-methionine-dependent methyltransferase [Dendrothele bispora CBS 962.96]